MSEKASAKVGVRTMREEIAILAGPRGWGVTRESWLSNAVDKLAECGSRVEYRMVKSFFYGEIQDDKHWAAIEIKRAVEIIEAQREAAALATQLETIISGLHTTDPDFHRPTIAALSSSLRQLRGEDRPGTHHKGEVKLGFDPPQD